MGNRWHNYLFVLDSTAGPSKIRKVILYRYIASTCFGHGGLRWIDLVFGRTVAGTGICWLLTERLENALIGFMIVILDRHPGGAVVHPVQAIGRILPAESRSARYNRVFVRL
jgi:hypothetical protein